MLEKRVAGAISAPPRPTAEEKPVRVGSTARSIDVTKENGIRVICCIVPLRISGLFIKEGIAR